MPLTLAGEVNRLMDAVIAFHQPQQPRRRPSTDYASLINDVQATTRMLEEKNRRRINRAKTNARVREMKK